MEKQQFITFANHFHGTRVVVRVRNGRIAGRTAKRIKRQLCGVHGCTCGIGECGTRSYAGPIAWIYADDGTRYQEYPWYDYRGRLTSVEIVEDD